jgi:uncharacterized membrane protein YeiH
MRGGFLAAFGGGTLRDVLLDRRPFFWAEHQSVLLVLPLLCIGCATLLKRQHLENSQRSLQVPDAIGLGLFCATGLHLSWGMGQPVMVAIMMGVITGTFGGVLRDLACDEMPSLFSDHRPYAVCALGGGLCYAGLAWLGAPGWVSVSGCAVTTSGLRLMTLWRDWKLPSVMDR